MLLSCLGAFACTEAGTTSYWTEVDSAGVRIVTSDPAGAPQGAELQLVASIGTVGDGGPSEFFQVRDVELLGPNGVAVANGGSQEVRIFDLEGPLVSSFGSSGRGPREFSGLDFVQDIGDSLFVYDRGNDRISVWTERDGFARSFRLEWFTGALSPVYVLASGRVLAVTGRYMTELEGTGLIPDTVLVSIYERDGMLADSVARLPYSERFVKQVGDRRTTIGVPYTQVASLVASDGRFCHAFGPNPEVRCYETSGTLALVSRVSAPRRPVTDSDVARYWDDIVSDPRPGYREPRLRLRGDVTFPEFFPAISALLIDDHGLVWAQQYRPLDEGDERWWVLDEGVLVEEVQSPRGFRMMDVKGPMLAGVWRDDLEVEYVRVYRR